MREQEVRELYEAYMQVHQPQEVVEEVEELDEGRTTSLSALSRESQKRKDDKKRGRPETESEIHSRLMMGKFRPGASQEERAEGGRQVLKDRGKVPKKGGKDMFEHILEHLVAEGYADTEQAAEAIMVNMSEDWRESIVEEVLDEAEGSYGQTPKAQQKMGDLANKRRNTPASEYSERGEKKKKVDSASRHFNRMGNPDAGNKGKKSSRPYYPAGRKGMTQKDRDWSRGADEYGHSGYDGEGGGGSLPKGKKLERQKKTGVSESFDLYDIILSHLLDEGYADTEQAAEAIMVNMSEDWREDIIIEAAKDQSDKQIDKGVKTTYKAQNVLDNQHQGRSRGLNRLPADERSDKTKKMRGRLKARRDDLFGERNKREDESRAELKKKYGL
jgi:hypothetical protein